MRLGLPPGLQVFDLRALALEIGVLRQAIQRRAYVGRYVLPSLEDRPYLEAGVEVGQGDETYRRAVHHPAMMGPLEAGGVHLRQPPTELVRSQRTASQRAHQG